MELLGEPNWWLPGWLARILPVAEPPARAGAGCPEPGRRRVRGRSVHGDAVEQDLDVVLGEALGVRAGHPGWNHRTATQIVSRIIR